MKSVMRHQFSQVRVDILAFRVIREFLDIAAYLDSLDTAASVVYPVSQDTQALRELLVGVVLLEILDIPVLVATLATYQTKANSEYR